ncbi:phosphatidate cytidylyltransferase [Aliiroseovarius sp. S1339]|uniref:phosphatidate cytidylyltransferase n=1 Tax=Aliiroseovarius sp. S1339 TaxID=2936990 RepID=UPI0020BDBDD1|nr:phosphatidate cytidylyltransferase [Aliiroseovarius sp. S1339]MCK8463549.1 phosphatidate cytidylyltransferase [Aliiroseovarius sp. S1339]
MKISNPSTNWSDLAPRVLSAIVLAAIAILAIALGNPIYLILIAVAIGLCVGEFARLLQPSTPKISVLLGGLATLAVFVAGSGINGADPGRGLVTAKTLTLLIPPLLGAVLIKEHRLLFLSYCSLIMLAGLGFIAMGPGPVLIWFLMIIIMSDVAGYFVGRTMGGPKFWPRISPKKTWSGTVAGWVGALLIGLLGATQGVFTPTEALFAPLIAFAGQMGDIVASAIKRKVGVKDSSNLIPGHGGMLDRFDAMIGAAGLLMVLTGAASLFVST